MRECFEEIPCKLKSLWYKSSGQKTRALILLFWALQLAFTKINNLSFSAQRLPKSVVKFAAGDLWKFVWRFQNFLLFVSLFKIVAGRSASNTVFKLTRERVSSNDSFWQGRKASCPVIHRRAA
jgi:hypothetical protein